MGFSLCSYDSNHSAQLDQRRISISRKHHRPTLRALCVLRVLCVKFLSSGLMELP